MNFRNKFDITKYIVYVVTFLLITYFLVLWLIPPHWLESISFGNILISDKAIDFGGFGGLLSGIFAPLAFLWLLLNFKQQEKSLKIAEKQLDILIQEKLNKRKVMKATFRTFPGTKELTFDENTRHYNLTLIPSMKLHECYIQPFKHDSFFKISTVKQSGIKFLGAHKGFFSADHELTLPIYFFKPRIKGESVIAEVFEINYLDEEGYQQNQLLNILFFPTFENGLLTDDGVLMVQFQ